MTDFTSDAERNAALRLVMARQHMAATAPLSMCPPWDALSEHEREMSLIEARNWLRAADNAGLTRRHETPDAGELHERLRTVALLMHGLDGHADACEDSGDVQGAAALREIAREVRAVLPETASAEAFTFGWAVRFTAPSGRAYVHEMPSELEARQALDDGIEPEYADRWALVRRILGPWQQVGE